MRVGCGVKKMVANVFDSSCYEEFTPGQQTRMMSFFNTYRANN